MTPPVENGVSCFLFFLYLLSPLIFLESLFDGKKCFKLYSCSIDILVCELVQQGGYFILTRYLLFDDGHESLYASWLMMEELHTDSIDGGHEASYGARSRARERAYSNSLTSSSSTSFRRVCVD
jgi:hypothetical protein